MTSAPFGCTLGRDAATKDRIFRLRHDCYLRKGSIEGRPDGRFSDPYDELPNSFSFLLERAPEAVGTVRISVVRPDLGWTDSPAQRVFGDHPAYQDIARQSYVEASRLCFGEQARRDAFVQLLGHKAALAELSAAEWLVACPRAEHAGVYQRLFGFRELAAARPYYGVSFETPLLGIRRGELLAFVQNMTPMRRAWLAALAMLRRLVRF